MTQQKYKPSTYNQQVIGLRKELERAEEKLEVVKKYGTYIRKWPTLDLVKELIERLRRRF